MQITKQSTFHVRTRKKEAGILNEDHALDHHEQQLKRRRRVDLDGGHNGGNEL